MPAKKKSAKKTTSAKKKGGGAVPKGYHTVTPSVNVSDAEQMITFCKLAFGAKVESRVPGRSGKIMHAEIRIGDSVVMLSDAVDRPAQPGGFFLYVPDVDKTCARAVQAGANLVMPAQDMFWGDRFANVTDAQGNSWGIATRRENLTPREMKKRAAAFLASLPPA